MNTYKISFTRENGTEGFDHFTAATERQARKDFHEVYRHGNGEIKSVELVRTDACATKQQEREALTKIRKLVEQLGPQSYVGTALEGCLEIAEQNIECDFADSMKDRLEASEKQTRKAEARIKELEEKLIESDKDYEAAHAAAHEIADKKDAEIAALKEQIKALEAKMPQADDIEDCIALAQERRSEYEQQMDEAAQKIVEFADAPDGAEFQQAVRDHRNAKRSYEYAQNLIKRLTNAR